jgi:hypothetical protein
MSRAIISDNLPDLAAWPHRLKFDPGFATSKLVEAWFAHAGLNVGLPGTVSEWVGIKGNAARHTATIGDPVYSATAGGAGIPGLVFGNPKILHSKLLPPVNGMLLAAFRTPAAAPAPHQCILGSRSSDTARCALYIDSTFNLWGNIGATANSGTQILRHATSLAASTNYVAAMAWDAAGLAALYLDSGSGAAQVDTAIWNGSGSTSGTQPLSIGGRNDVAVVPPTGNLKFEGAIMAAAVFTGSLTSAEAIAITSAVPALLPA